MTVPKLIEFIKQKAPPPVFAQFARLQKKTRPELCKLLAQFEEGYRLLYPANKPKTPEPDMPASNNIEGMFNMAERLQAAQVSKNSKKIANRYNAFGFNLPASPSSPASISESTPGTPDYVNYMNNNNAPSENARMRERNAYLRKLANKRIVRDPMEGKLSAADMKRFRVQTIKEAGKSPLTIPKKGISRQQLMNFGNGNMRARTNTVGGLAVSTSPRISSNNRRIIKTKVQATKNTLTKLLKSFQNTPVKQRPTMMRTRITFLKKILADPNIDNKLFEKEKYRTTLLQRLGLKSPPRKPNAPPFSATTMNSRNLTKTQKARISKILQKKTAAKSEPVIDSAALRAQYHKQLMNNLVKLRTASRPLSLSNSTKLNNLAGYMSKVNITNFNIEGKQCMTYKKTQLVKAARLVTGGKINSLESFTKQELCQIIKHNLTKK
tara:strand:+ start:1 stop:1314 length:1314 start_codon:yes stop_codon:yes gene_type:complete